MIEVARAVNENNQERRSPRAMKEGSTTRARSGGDPTRPISIREHEHCYAEQWRSRTCKCNQKQCAINHVTHPLPQGWLPNGAHTADIVRLKPPATLTFSTIRGCVRIRRIRCDTLARRATVFPKLSSEIGVSPLRGCKAPLRSRKRRDPAATIPVS